MARMDLILLLVFGVTALVALLVAVLCFRKALRVSNQRDGDLKMFFWALGSFIALIIAGMSTAYIVLPIVLH
jgi:uncharacterized BrkB/YihY/UPF0761 family membrane protein